MEAKDLLEAGINFIKTKAGQKALGIGLDAAFLKTPTEKTSEDPPNAKSLKDKLKSYTPKLEEFEIEGRLYDEITSKPIEGASVEPILALQEGKKIFTDENGKFNIKLKIPILPYNNKALVESKLVYTKKGYIPQYAELLTSQRRIKNYLSTKPLLNIKLAADFEVDELKIKIYEKIEEAANKAASLPEKILIVRRKAIEKMTNTILFKLLPLGIGLLLVFGITKIKDRNKKICPTPSQLKRAAKKRNSIVKAINQLYLMLIVNVGLAVLFNYLFIQLKGVRVQISSLSFPTSVPPGVGVPYSLISTLENVKGILDKLANQNKALNIQLIIALIFFVVGMIIITMILKTIDSLIFECAKDTEINLEELNPEIQNLTKEAEDNIVTPDKINGFRIEVIEVDKNAVGKYKRRQAVGKNSQGVILVRGDESFGSSDSALINELIFYIRSNDLKAY